MKIPRLLLPFLALLLGFAWPAPAATTVSFSNGAPITINDNAIASPYPSTITVSNPATTTTKIQVLLNNFSHTYPKDVDILLVGPQGQRCMLMSDAGGGNPGVMSAILNFSSTFPTVVPQNTAPSGNYRPANYANDFNPGDLTDSFPAPGPGTLNDQPADLNVFNLTNPNGTWSLYVVDDTSGDAGSIAGGWILQVTVPAVFTVTNTNDSGAGSLRAALAAAGNDDLINFSSLFNTPQTINLLTALPNITASVTIQGPGANLLTVRRDYNAATDFRVFNIPGGVANGVAISGMTIANGNAGSALLGGGISSLSSLTLTNVHITGNRAGAAGGANLAFADGTFTGCTFSGNRTTNAAGSGGGILYQGDGGHTLRFVSCTVSGNSSANGGGGLGNASAGGDSRLEVVNSTVTGNNAAGGGGIATFTQGAGTTATTTLRNTIIASNTPNNLTTGGGAATVTTLGFNLSDNYNGVFTPLATDKTTATPRLGPLSLNGGQTPTHALLGGSPALDAGDASGMTTDQRGAPRVFSTSADIGAVEMQTDPFNFTVFSTSDAGAGSLRQAITNANASGPALRDIVFANNLSGTTINLLTALPDITTSLTINGRVTNPTTGQLDSIVVQRDSAAANFRIFNIAPFLSRVAINTLTITNGNAGSGIFGGGIFSNSSLTLTNVYLTGNQAGNGGGVELVFADGVFTGCTFSANVSTDAASGGGGVGFEGDGGHTLRIVSSTVSG
ncbi:MAG: choice-of-anchor Q domain-containing protein, partial [Chthoniobacterales bacterium]